MKMNKLFEDVFMDIDWSLYDDETVDLTGLEDKILDDMGYSFFMIFTMKDGQTGELNSDIIFKHIISEKNFNYWKSNKIYTHNDALYNLICSTSELELADGKKINAIIECFYKTNIATSLDDDFCPGLRMQICNYTNTKKGGWIWKSKKNISNSTNHNAVSIGTINDVAKITIVNIKKLIPSLIKCLENYTLPDNADKEYAEFISSLLNFYKGIQLNDILYSIVGTRRDAKLDHSEDVVRDYSDLNFGDSNLFELSINDTFDHNEKLQISVSHNASFVDLEKLNLNGINQVMIEYAGLETNSKSNLMLLRNQDKCMSKVHLPSRSSNNSEIIFNNLDSHIKLFGSGDSCPNISILNYYVTCYDYDTKNYEYGRKSIPMLGSIENKSIAMSLWNNFKNLNFSAFKQIVIKKVCAKTLFFGGVGVPTIHSRKPGLKKDMLKTDISLMKYLKAFFAKKLPKLDFSKFKIIDK